MGRSSAKNSDLIQIIAEFDEIKRIRFTTSHPNDVDKNLLDCFQSVPKLANQFHLPAVWLCGILRRMKHYTKQKYLEIISDIKKIRPDIPVSSDFIVGFLVKKSHFHEAMQLVEEVKFGGSTALFTAKDLAPCSWYER